MTIINSATTPQSEIIATAVQVLRAGGLIIYPTETVYGIGCDPTNPAAVIKLLAYKTRREGKPISIAVDSQKMASQFVEINEQAQKIYDRFLPGPITVVSKSREVVVKDVESEFGTLGIRIPDHQLVLDIVKAFGKPITSTSANASGKKRPYSIADIFSNISDKQKNLIDLIIDAGTLPPNQPSTVIDTTLSTPLTFRQGDVAIATDTASAKLHSSNERETMDIAGKLLFKHWNTVQKNGLIIGLHGPLGAGKTIFAKGIARFLQTSETLDSPTYTYMEEYVYKRHHDAGMLYHLDVWKIDTEEQWQLLEVTSLLKPNTIILIEWFGQIKSFLSPQTQKQCIEVTLEPLEAASEHGRDISISEPSL